MSVEGAGGLEETHFPVNDEDERTLEELLLTLKEQGERGRDWNESGEGIGFTEITSL